MRESVLVTRPAKEPCPINDTGRIGYGYVEDVARAFVQGALETRRGSIVVDLPSELANTEEFAATIRRVLPGTQITVDGPAIPSNVPPQPNYYWKRV